MDLRLTVLTKTFLQAKPQNFSRNQSPSDFFGRKYLVMSWSRHLEFAYFDLTRRLEGLSYWPNTKYGYKQLELEYFYIMVKSSEIN